MRTLANSCMINFDALIPNNIRITSNITVIIISMVKQAQRLHKLKNMAYCTVFLKKLMTDITDTFIMFLGSNNMHIVCGSRCLLFSAHINSKLFYAFILVRCFISKRCAINSATSHLGCILVTLSNFCSLAVDYSSISN